MTADTPHLPNQPSACQRTTGQHRLGGLEDDAASYARRLAASEVGAAIAHQLNDPLTALLLYLCEIREDSWPSTHPDSNPTSIRELAEKALQEAERICAIMKQTGTMFGTPVGCEPSLAHGRELMSWWMRNTTADGTSHSAPARAATRKYRLTPRETQVLDLITEGVSNKEGGHRLGITTRTFEHHRARVMHKLGARNTAALVRIALREPNDARSQSTNIF